MLTPRNTAERVHGCFNPIMMFELPAALRAAQTCRYLIYSEADFEVFRPAGATCCTDWGEIWHGGPSSVGTEVPRPCQISPPSVQHVAPAGRKTSKSASE